MHYKNAFTGALYRPKWRNELWGDYYMELIQEGDRYSPPNLVIHPDDIPDNNERDAFLALVSNIN